MSPQSATSAADVGKIAEFEGVPRFEVHAAELTAASVEVEELHERDLERRLTGAGVFAVVPARPDVPVRALVFGITNWPLGPVGMPNRSVSQAGVEPSSEFGKADESKHSLASGPPSAISFVRSTEKKSAASTRFGTNDGS